MLVGEGDERVHCVGLRHCVRIRDQHVLTRSGGDSEVDVGRERERTWVLEHADTCRHLANRARKVRDHERLVDLRDERGQRALELGRMAVGDDDRRDLHVPSISRYTASVRSAAVAPAEGTRTFEPRRDESIPLGERAADAIGQLGLLDEDRGVPRHLAQGRIRHGDDRRPRCHGLEDGEPEALVPTRLDETRRAAVELGEPFRRHVALEPGAARAQLLCELWILGRVRRRRAGDPHPSQPPGRRAGSSVAGSLPPTGRSRAPPIRGRRPGRHRSASRRSAVPGRRTAPRCQPSFARRR